MKFEEILPLMREGKKAKHMRMKEGEYWICGHSSFAGSEKWPTLIKVFKNPFQNERTPDQSSYSWGIERWALLCDTWEIVQD